jgi:hypothetical protein
MQNAASIVIDSRHASTRRLTDLAAGSSGDDG